MVVVDGVARRCIRVLEGVCTLDLVSFASAILERHGMRIRIHTASIQCTRATQADLTDFVWEGDTVPSEAAGLRTPGVARHGQGTIRYASGSSYSGAWENDKRHGFGKMAFACGDEYEGQWVDGKYEGHGKYSSKESDEYDGEWQSDTMHGQGKYLYRATGDVYEGGFADGKRHGFGKLTCANGDVFIGEFEAGELVTPAST